MKLWNNTCLCNKKINEQQEFQFQFLKIQFHQIGNIFNIDATVLYKFEYFIALLCINQTKQIKSSFHIFKLWMCDGTDNQSSNNVRLLNYHLNNKCMPFKFPFFFCNFVICLQNGKSNITACIQQRVCSFFLFSVFFLSCCCSLIAVHPLKMMSTVLI